MPVITAMKNARRACPPLQSTLQYHQMGSQRGGVNPSHQELNYWLSGGMRPKSVQDLWYIINESEFLFQETQLSSVGTRVAILNARLVSINFAANLRFGSCFPALPTNYCARRVGRQKLLKKKLYIYRNYMIEMPIIMRGEPINKYYGTGKKQRCTTSVMPVMGHCDWNIGDKSGHRSLRCKLIFWLEI